MKTRFLLCCLLVFISCWHSLAYAGQDLNQLGQASDYDKGIELNSLVIVDHEYSIDFIVGNFETLPWVSSKELEYMNWHSQIWQSIKINNSTSENAIMYLLLDRSFTVPTEMYFLKNDVIDSVQLGDFENQSLINSIYPVFELRLEPGINHVFFRYLGTRENPSAVLYSAKGFAESGSLRIGILSFVMGMIILMAVYNLVIFLNERRIEYVYYLLYLGSVFLLALELIGAGRFFFHTTHTHLGPELFALSPTFLCLFYLSMFDWKSKRPRIFFQVRIIILIGVVYTAFAFVAPMEQKFFAYIYYIPIMFYVSVLGLFSLLSEAIRGSTQALLLFLGLLALVIGTLISFLGFYGYAAEVFSYAPLVTYAIEITFFSFALSVRRREELLAEIEAKKHSYGQLAKVFYPHQLEQMRAGKNLEETMPEGDAEACVIAFDVAASSQIKSPKIKDFLHNVMKACELEMVANYDPRNMSSDAYRVKEMGDGFLCSIGFPFEIKEFPNSSEASWFLAKRFIKAFEKEVQAFGYTEPIYCGIGVALDQIEGYFPSSGTRQYDLYGRSIVLATRYESYRKMLFEQIHREGSVIILQSAVYDNLPKEEQDKLSYFDLGESKFKIRDDFSADRLYYYISQENE